jgi:hypothetical protein
MGLVCHEHEESEGNPEVGLVGEPGGGDREGDDRKNDKRITASQLVGSDDSKEANANNQETRTRPDSGKEPVSLKHS